MISIFFLEIKLVFDLLVIWPIPDSFPLKQIPILNNF